MSTPAARSVRGWRTSGSATSACKVNVEVSASRAMSSIATTMTAPLAKRITHIGHIHNFRGLAAVFIVATHVLAALDWSNNPGLERVLRYFFANGTTFFLFISGYLFEYLSSRFEVASYWRQKLRFVVLPYLIVSAPALFLFTQVMHREGVGSDFYQQPVTTQIIQFLVTGKHLAPFWFIPTIVAFFLFAPVIRAAFRRDAAFATLQVLLLLPAWFSRSANALLNLIHFLPIWVMGMAICRFRDTMEPWLQAKWFVLLVAGTTLGVAEFVSTAGTHTYLGYLQKTLLILFLLSALLTLGQRADRWLGWAGTLSFGIFFVHSYVISASSLTLKRLFGTLPDGNLFMVVVATATAVAISALIVHIVCRMLGPRSRLLIGV